MFSNQDHLKIISNCPVCDSRNFPAQIKLLNENDVSHLLHIQCRKCKSCIIVLITSGPQGVMSMGLLTDLKSDEVLKFSKGQSISADDVLDIHELLESKSQKIFELL
jgi:hypothetical protein